MIKDQLKKDLIVAMKAGEPLKRSVIGMVLSNIKNRELDKRGKLMKAGASTEDAEAQSALTDDEAMESLMTEVKKRKDSIQQFTDGGRPELAANEQAEIDILAGYLPEQVGEAELREAIKATIAEMGITDVKEMGKVMSAVMAKFKGRADGTLVSSLVKEALTA